MRAKRREVTIPTFGVEEYQRKGKVGFLYRQLDGSYIMHGECVCVWRPATECPIDTHRIPAILRSPMWE